MLTVGWGARARYVVPPPLPADFDADTVRTIKRVRRHTMTSPARLAAMLAAVEHAATAPVPGAIVECGVWRGGSMMGAALTLLRLGAPDRELWLYDTFTGMTAPAREDVDSPYDGFSLSRMWERRRRGDMNWIGVPAADVRSAMDATGYPRERVHLVEGPVEATLPGQAPDQIAVLRLDTDWYASTLHELQHLYPRVVPGGVLLLDDYGHYAGARRAVDEYFAAHGPPPLLQRIDYTGRVAIKVRP